MHAAWGRDALCFSWLADYPLPYNGESNFANIAAIPAAAIERIEVLSGGASAIYGSDAVAGVVNIILHKNLPYLLDVNIRTGATTQGGGQSTRVQGVGGFSNDVFRVTYAAEFSYRKPIYAYERDFMDSIYDHPNPAARIPARAILREDPLDRNGDGFGYIDPGASVCGRFPGFEYSLRPGRGYYCGQSQAEAQQTIRNGRKDGSLYVNGALDLGGSELFGSLMYFHSNSKFDDNFHFWTPLLGDYVYNESINQYESLQRYFLPFEAGGRDAFLNKFNETSWNANAGIRGDFADSGWDYEVSLNHSNYKLENKVRRMLFDEVETYFLGPVTGRRDPIFNLYPAYADVNIARLYTPLTPDVYNQLSAVQKDTADSSNSTANIIIRGDLLQLPAGPVSAAGIVEWGTQKYDIDLDPRYVAGDFWGITGTGGGGKRDRYAAGLELSIPIVEQLRASLAGRYDKYDDITQVDDALTYKVGLAYRPTKSLLLRGSAASSFRAPDMHYVFADPSGYFESGPDEYLCRRDQPNVPLFNCTFSNVDFQGASQGNPNLEEEKGKSFTVGFVIEPLADLSFSVDYYHLDLDGVVVDYPLDRILSKEADCRLGRTANGAPVDANSNECREAIARVRRNPVSTTLSSEQIQFVTTGPINTANYKTSGFDARLAYKFPQTPVGVFSLETTYTHVLKYEIQDFAGDAVKNHRDFPERPSFDLRSHVRSSLTWKHHKMDSTLFMERLGSIPNWTQTGRIPAQTYFNLSANYWIIENRASVGFVVDNLFDRDPPRDPTYDEYPYYSTFNYSPIGREWFLQLRYRFD